MCTISWILSLISESNLTQIIIIAGKKSDDSPTWTQTLWNSEKEFLKKKYSDKKFSIAASDNMGRRHNEFWLMINKM